MSTTLGLDLGTNSIGWALINPDDHQIIDTGVRIFEEGVNRQGGREKSKNATRRDARLSRKQNARWKARRNKLIYILKESGMYPENEDDIINYMRMDPYEIRARGLDYKLTLFEFGRALYHINQRRGFKSNRKTDTPNENSAIYEGKDDKTGITETKEEMEKTGYRTLGEMLYHIDPHDERRRNRYTLRQMYIEEFQLLWDRQKKDFPTVLTDEVGKKIFDAIFYQRRLKSQKHTVAHCPFEPKKKVSPKGAPIFQEYRILEQLSRIRITSQNRNNEPLSSEEHGILHDELEKREKMTFKQIRKKLGFGDDVQINLQSQDKLWGHTTNYRLAKVFGKKEWYNFSEEKRDEIWHTLHFYNDPPDKPNWLEDHAREKWDLDNDQIELLHKVVLESDYAGLSHKAMKKIIPYLQQPFNKEGESVTYDKAVKAAGYHHSVIQKYGTAQHKQLPEPKNLRNPIVQQALHELRTVTNAIISTHGIPDTIRVELARDTKWPKWKRTSQYALNNRRNERAEEIKQRLVNEGISKQPSRDDVIKYLLWEECNQTCPYTGKKISLSALYGINGAKPEFEIEHIIPYSRSLDDSQANKTLCYWKENQTKHNKTPFEAYGHEPMQYQKILDRVKQFKPVDVIVRVSTDRGRIQSRPNNKIRKFVMKEVDDDFLQRQLVDTAYISREVRVYLQSISEKVVVTSGSVTGKLRVHWGLNSILSGAVDIKRRDDHRHHAIDALVIAATTQGQIQQISKLYSRDVDMSHYEVPLPCNSFHSDAWNQINNILVSHRINNRPRGSLHEETNYGRIEMTTNDGERVKTFVTRKPIENITANQINHIVDQKVRDIVLTRLRNMGIDVSTKFKIPADAFNEPLFMPGGKHPIKTVRVAVPTQKMLKLYPNRNLYVEFGKNHHIEIFENDEGKRTFRVVPLWDAVNRYKSGKPLVDTNSPADGYGFYMSLAINEMVLIDVKEDQIDWDNPPNHKDFGTQLYRIQKMDVNGILTFRHHTVSITDSDKGRIIKRVNKLHGLKVHIDPLGNIAKA